jgi:hypothetical protein
VSNQGALKHKAHFIKHASKIPETIDLASISQRDALPPNTATTPGHVVDSSPLNRTSETAHTLTHLASTMGTKTTRQSNPNEIETSSSLAKKPSDTSPVRKPYEEERRHRHHHKIKTEKLPSNPVSNKDLRDSLLTVPQSSNSANRASQFSSSNKPSSSQQMALAKCTSAPMAVPSKSLAPLDMIMMSMSSTCPLNNSLNSSKTQQSGVPNTMGTQPGALSQSMPSKPTQNFNSQQPASSSYDPSRGSNTGMYFNSTSGGHSSEFESQYAQHQHRHGHHHHHHHHHGHPSNSPHQGRHSISHISPPLPSATAQLLLAQHRHSYQHHPTLTSTHSHSSHTSMMFNTNTSNTSQGNAAGQNSSSNNSSVGILNKSTLFQQQQQQQHQALSASLSSPQYSNSNTATGSGSSLNSSVSSTAVSAANSSNTNSRQFTNQHAAAAAAAVLAIHQQQQFNKLASGSNPSNGGNNNSVASSAPGGAGLPAAGNSTTALAAAVAAAMQAANNNNNNNNNNKPPHMTDNQVDSNKSDEGRDQQLNHQHHLSASFHPHASNTQAPQQSSAIGGHLLAAVAAAFNSSNTAPNPANTSTGNGSNPDHASLLQQYGPVSGYSNGPSGGSANPAVALNASGASNSASGGAMLRHIPSSLVDQLELSEQVEELVSRDTIKRCIRKAKHRGNFAANLAAELFTKEERIAGNCTGKTLHYELYAAPQGKIKTYKIFANAFMRVIMRAYFLSSLIS